MTEQPGTEATAPLTFSALRSAISTPRLAAYSLEADGDCFDAVARYMWNLALATAFHPVLHTTEIAFRNALFETGVQTTAPLQLRTDRVACWLDAVPSLLEQKECDDVAKAVRLLGPKRRTAGHLVGQLGFGFWVRLCNRPYEQGRNTGPRLWPTAVRRFPGCPRSQKNRADIQRAFSDLRDFRNLVAHHQPIWDRDPVRWHGRAIELLSWMNPGLARTLRHRSTVAQIFEAGPAAFRAEAERNFSICR